MNDPVPVSAISTPGVTDVGPVGSNGTGGGKLLTADEVRSFSSVYSTSEVDTLLAAKQATLVSGTNIKTINNTSLLGSGNITVSASPAGSSGQVQYNNSGAFGAADAVVYAGSGQLWIGNISQPGDISLRGDWSASGRYGLSYDVSNDATVLYSYNGRKFILGTRAFAGAFQPRFTFNDASGVQTWTHTEGINYVFGTSTGTKIGTGTTQKIGFWNATPVVQQVLATGTGATVDDVISLLQTLGLCKQS